jgi:hypothetical protein
MSDFFNGLYFPDVEATSAEIVGALALQAMQQVGLLASQRDDRSVLGQHPGYRPGAKYKELYVWEHNDTSFLSLLTNGAAFHFGAYANMWAVSEWFRCPQCDAHIGREADKAAHFRVLDQMMAGVAHVEQHKELPAALRVHCPACQQCSLEAHWASEVPIGLSHLAIEFWNWPIFKTDLFLMPNWAREPKLVDGWKIDVPRLLYEATGSRVMWTYGRI